MTDAVHVPFLDVHAAYRELRDELDAACRRVMDSGIYILGPEVDAFEASFARYCGATHCVGVANGLDALHLILRAYGIGEGDEVIVPSNTFIATWLAVSFAGARPVPVEPQESTYTIAAAAVEAAVSARTRAIIAVHLYGFPAEMEGLRAVASRHALPLIEDAAQAHGAERAGRRAGTLGDAAAFSFYPAKNLGALGDAGAVVTNDATVAGRIRLLRNYGSAAKYRHDTKGVNSRMDPLQAAFLAVKLAHLDEWNARRRRVAQIYLDGLKEVADVSLPTTFEGIFSAWHLFVVRHPRRDEFAARLRRAGIDTIVHYPIPPHLSPAYRELGYAAGSLPVAETLARAVLSLPIGPHQTPALAEQVVECVRRVC